jgi:DNA primase
MSTPRRLSPADITRIRNQHPIDHVLQLLGIDLPARWNGTSDLRISCPTRGHADEHPSCVVHPATGRFHCFACGAHGDAFTLVRELTGLTNLAEIADLLDAGRRITPAGHTVRRPTAPAVAVQTGERPDPTRTSLQRVLEINTEAWQLFTSRLNTHVARRYLTERGINIDALETISGQPFAGYTPASRFGLAIHLQSRGFTPDEIIDAGWAIRRDETLVDRFRRRILMPIHNDHGQLLGIIGRDITGIARQKYLNTADTAAFHKGSVLYRPSRLALAPDATVIVCEGAIDALAITAAAAVTGQSTTITAVAASGTALTPNQATLVRGIGARTVIVCADSDPAGVAAADSWTERLNSAGCKSVHVATLPNGHDPAAWVQLRGARALADLHPNEMSLRESYDARTTHPTMSIGAP